ncbi:hypothetical protein MTO96_044981 [Rhipicephalus appendiculatus]
MSRRDNEKQNFKQPAWKALKTVIADDYVTTSGLRSIKSLVNEAKETKSDSIGKGAVVCDPLLPSMLENHHALDVLRHPISAGSKKKQVSSPKRGASWRALLGAEAQSMCIDDFVGGDNSTGTTAELTDMKTIAKATAEQPNEDTAEVDPCKR